jgi:hypothetical protein
MPPVPITSLLMAITNFQCVTCVKPQVTFSGRSIHEYLRIAEEKKLQTTSFHPESNDSLERSHRILKEYLRHYIDADQRNWDMWIKFAVCVYNTTIHKSTMFTPFEFLYGFKSSMPSDLQELPSVQYNYEDFLTEVKCRSQTAHSVAREKS